MKALRPVAALTAALSLSLVVVGTASAAQTFYMPKRANQYGTLKLIFIDYRNGEEFCEEEGYSHAIGGTVYCGEDESSYVSFDWGTQSWRSKSTGSANGCWPMWASITCD